MTIDFKPLAVEFVRLNHCAQHTPVELIEKAMTIGAAEMAAHAIEVVSGSSARLKSNRLNNLGNHSGFAKVIPLHEP